MHLLQLTIFVCFEWGWLKVFGPKPAPSRVFYKLGGGGDRIFEPRASKSNLKWLHFDRVSQLQDGSWTGFNLFPESCCIWPGFSLGFRLNHH